MATVSFDELQTRLREQLARLAPGESVEVTIGADKFAVEKPAAPVKRSWTPIRYRVEQWHWDAMPMCYTSGGVVGLGFMAMDGNPLVGFGIGFLLMAFAVAVTYTAVIPEIENDAQ